MSSFLSGLVNWLLDQLANYRPHKGKAPVQSPVQPPEPPSKPLQNSELYAADSFPSAQSLIEATSEKARIEKEIRAGRKFSMAEAIGREGGSFMKGESAVPRPLRAANEIKQFIATHSSDPTGILASELYLWATADIRVSRQLDTPLVALAQIVESLLNESTIFYEFARQMAIAQSKLTGDRPYFQQPNQPPHPDADYTHQTIRQYLSEMAAALSL